jgi:hypothetical protein
VLNFEIDRAVLAPLLPRSCELDLWNGAALISLVGFQFLDTRVLGRAIPLHRNFDEVNLRFYVIGPQGRGVVFIREVVPKRAIALIANTLYGENYLALPMSQTISSNAARYACEPVSAMFADGSGVTVHRKEAALTAIGRSGSRSEGPANPAE